LLISRLPWALRVFYLSCVGAAGLSLLASAYARGREACFEIAKKIYAVPLRTRMKIKYCTQHATTNRLILRAVGYNATVSSRLND
jgi:hypothetical protein